MGYLVSAVENHCRTLKSKAELEIDCKDPRKEDLKIFQKIQFFIYSNIDKALHKVPWKIYKIKFIFDRKTPW